MKTKLPEVPEVWKKVLFDELYANLGTNWLLQKLFNIEPIPILCFGSCFRLQPNLTGLCIFHLGNNQLLHSLFVDVKENFLNYLMGTIQNKGFYVIFISFGCSLQYYFEISNLNFGDSGQVG